MLTDAEILDLIRRCERHEISVKEMNDTLEAHGVTLDRFRRVNRRYTIVLLFKCMVIVAAVWAVTGWVVWMVKG